MKNHYLFFTILCVALFLVGCNQSKISGLVPVEGVLTYNGIPLPWTSISFTQKENKPGARMAAGQTDAQGRFYLLTIGERGALPDVYRVSLSRYIKNEGPNTVENWKKKRESGTAETIETEETMNVVSVIPGKYKDTRTSGLEITVGPQGERDLKIEIVD